MADQAEKAAIAFALALLAQYRQVLARGHQGGARAMLQAAVAVARDHGHEHVAAGAVQEGRLLAARLEEGDLRLADALHVGGDARQVQPRRHAGEHQFVFGAMRLETDDLRRAHLDRVVDQRVVVGRAVAAEAMAAGRARQPLRLGQAGVDLPAFDAARRRQVENAGRVFLPVHAQENAGAVEKAVAFVQVRAAHREIPRIHRIVDLQRAAARRHLPGVVVDLVHRHRPAAGARGQRLDLAGEIAYQVAAGNPRGQGQALSLGRRLGHGQGYPVAVTGRVVGFQAVNYGCVVHAHILHFIL
ncbi:Uncharacterised protein [Bordetella pertussis]|nr:Uncharacterised protein [Bordetella pertussis]